MSEAPTLHRVLVSEIHRSPGAEATVCGRDANSLPEADDIQLKAYPPSDTSLAVCDKCFPVVVQ